MKIDPYLWDKSRPRDAFISKLEGLLAKKRAKVKRAGRPRMPVLRIVVPIALTAAAAVLVWVLARPGDADEAPQPSSGAPPIAEQSIPAPKTDANKGSQKTGQGKPGAVKGKTVPEDKSLSEQALGQPGDNPSQPDTGK